MELTPFRRFTLAVCIVAAVAISDGWLYVTWGTPATYSWHIYRYSGRYPILPAVGGGLVVWWALRSGAADDWRVLILAAGILAGHFWFPICIYLGG